VALRFFQVVDPPLEQMTSPTMPTVNSLGVLNGAHGFKSFFELWQVLFDHQPDRVEIKPEIIMYESRVEPQCTANRLVNSASVL
jgi:hypothetical protein